jgi:hypothetical protein
MVVERECESPIRSFYVGEWYLGGKLKVLNKHWEEKNSLYESSEASQLAKKTCPADYLQKDTAESCETAV